MLFGPQEVDGGGSVAIRGRLVGSVGPPGNANERNRALNGFNFVTACRSHSLPFQFWGLP